MNILEWAERVERRADRQMAVQLARQERAALARVRRARLRRLVDGGTLAEIERYVKKYRWLPQSYYLLVTYGPRRAQERTPIIWGL